MFGHSPNSTMFFVSKGRITVDNMTEVALKEGVQ
jgi:hypothetical protein